VKSLTERLFNAKIEIIKELQHLQYQEEEYIAYRNELIDEVLAEINKLNEENLPRTPTYSIRTQV